VSRFRKLGLAVFGLAVGGFCLWLALRGVDWRESLRIFRAADPAGVIAGVALYGAGMVMRAGRWRAILAFRAPVGFGTVLRALLAGYAVNSALPARLGELFRADYMARLTGLSRSAVLASIVVERLLDLIAAVGILVVGMAIVGDRSSASLRTFAVGALAAVAVGTALLLIAARLSHGKAEALLGRLLSRLPWGSAVARQLGPRVGDFAQLLQIMRSSQFIAVVLATLPIWAIETLGVWSICRAAGVDLALPGMMCLMGAASLSTLMPTAPAYAGSYQFAYVVTLAQFGIGATAAIAAATTVQIYLIGGFTLLGVLTLAASAMLAARFGTAGGGRPR
jgi:uncharacterized protein (TIRG00374 family)